MKLENERLQVYFAEGGEVITQRFDNTAIVTRVVLDGEYAFCVPEQVLPGRPTTKGAGLCGEFVLLGAAEEAKAGDWFCKPGVGLLRQQQDQLPYDIWRTYAVRPFPVTAERTEDGLCFRQQAVPWGGYGLDIGKTFRLRGNCLLLDIRVRNVGGKAALLQEYQHNFVSLGGRPVSEGYRLELGCDRALARIERETLRQGDEVPLPSAVRVRGGSVLWKTAMDGRVLYHRSEDVDREAPHRWRLSHSALPVSVTEETDFCPDRIDVWAVEHCICTEFYHSVRLAPGEEALWRRRWTFQV